MRPRLLIPALATAALLAAAPSALAKGVLGGKVCAEDGCTKLSQRTAEAFIVGGSRSYDAPNAGARIVTVTLTMGAHEVGEVQRMTLDYAPSLGVIREHGARDIPWTQLDARARALVSAAIPPAKPAPVRASVARPQDDGAPRWWLFAAGAALLAVLARYATRALNARPRAS